VPRDEPEIVFEVVTVAVLVPLTVPDRDWRIVHVPVPDALNVLEELALPLIVAVAWTEREPATEREPLGLPVGVRDGGRERVGDELAVLVLDGLILLDIVGLEVPDFEMLGDPVVVFEALKVRVELLLPVLVWVDAVLQLIAGLELAVLEGAALFVPAKV
jgi:hypothetical protein